MQPLRFGVATADHQCEAYDGRDDIRDVWERERGLVPRGKATDFWNRYREDVDLAKGLGCTAFRLSLAWARLEPQAGQWDDAAFAHYREVLQYLRNAGMMTVVTLHHNTWPLHVQAAGNGAGMLDPGFPDRVAAYAEQVAKRLGDLIDYYVTLNEPNQLVYGYIKGFWMRAYPMPPGLEPYATGEQQMDAVLRLIPNLFRAHMRARAAVRSVCPLAKVGANPLVLGLPRWLQRIFDRSATHLKSPENARKQAARLSQHTLLDSGAVDCSIAQITMTQDRMERVLFSEPYYEQDAHPYAVAMALGSRSLLNAVDAALRDFKKSHPDLPRTHTRKTVAHIGKDASAPLGPVPDMDASLKAIRKRGVLRVGIHPGPPELCTMSGGQYAGLEPELARYIAKHILGERARVEFTCLRGENRVNATRSPLRLLDGLRKSFGMFSTLIGTNWWNLGLAGKLPEFLCPKECVGTLDYAGFDYYWGVPNVLQFDRLAAASECRYANAPVWPGVLQAILEETEELFPGKPIIVIENGCVTSADGYTRARYVQAHVEQILRARDAGVPVEAYLCWAITSNREWGLHFDANSDFGLYHIDLDVDPQLKRIPTDAAKAYAQLIASANRSVSP